MGVNDGLFVGLSVGCSVGSSVGFEAGAIGIPRTRILSQ